MKGKDGMGVRKGLGMIILWDLHIGLGMMKTKNITDRQVELRLMCTLKIDFRVTQIYQGDTHPQTGGKHTHTLNLQSCGSIDTFNLTQFVFLEVTAQRNLAAPGQSPNPEGAQNISPGALVHQS